MSTTTEKTTEQTEAPATEPTTSPTPTATASPATEPTTSPTPTATTSPATEQTTSPTPTATTSPATEQTEAQATPETDPEPTDKAGKEAARYRRQLRETEGALQAAQGATEAAQRALVEHMAQARGIKPAALWASGTELSGLLDEGGHVDPQKVSQAADGAAASLGLARTPRADPTQGGMGDGASPAPKFSDAFGPQ